MWVLFDSILRLDTIYGWLGWIYGSFEFRRLDASCGWFHPLVDSSSGSWIQVAIDSILWLTRVPMAGYKLPLSPSHRWLEFGRLDTSYSWLHPTTDSNSGAWIRLIADLFLRLTKSCDWLGFWRLETSFQRIPSCGWFYPAADSSSAGWTRFRADLYFNISGKFKDLFCRLNHFYGLFSTA